MDRIQKRNAKLPTNLTTASHPVHRWFNFIAGYSPEFVRDCIRSAQLNSNSLVIDPFAGLSTTLVQARFEGVSAVGFEPHPFFFDISKAKINPPNADDLTKVLGTLRRLKPYPGQLSAVWNDTALVYLRKLIPEDSLMVLASAVKKEGSVDASLQPIYRLIVSRVLEFTSGSKTDGIYKAPTSIKKAISYDAALAKVALQIEEDIAQLPKAHKSKTRLFFGSSEDMSQVKSGSCDLCVTSPPYLNNFDYAEMTRMELYFWRYAEDWAGITRAVRSRLVVNTTTAPTGRKDKGDYKHTMSEGFSKKLDKLVYELKNQHSTRAGKKDYFTLVYPYFSQMKQIISELHRVLKPGALSYWVIGDSALYGVHIKTDKLLAELMQEAGFEVVRNVILRKRGDRWVLKKRQGARDGLGEFNLVTRKI